ncbi:MAG: GNAT family N-acetyltransferase [Tetrasphaera sp.]|nr:GNAT family N-acetyltransferase [Tetrasphaera sp.]
MTHHEPSVLLRPMVEADLPYLAEPAGEFDDFGLPPRTQVHLTSFESDGGLTVEVGGECAGSVSWHWTSWGPGPLSRTVMIGIGLRESYRGRGIGTLAQQLLVDAVFRGTSVNRVEAHTDIENHAEQRALEKVGFTQEGVVRGGQWRAGAYRDGYLYSILRAEWALRQAATLAGWSP